MFNEAVWRLIDKYGQMIEEVAFRLGVLQFVDAIWEVLLFFSIASIAVIALLLWKKPDVTWERIARAAIVFGVVSHVVLAVYVGKCFYDLEQWVDTHPKLTGILIATAPDTFEDLELFEDGNDESTDDSGSSDLSIWLFILSGGFCVGATPTLAFGWAARWIWGDCGTVEASGKQTS